MNNLMTKIDPQHEEIANKLNNIHAVLNYDDANILSGIQTVHVDVQEIGRRMDNAFKKERKSSLHLQMATAENGEIVLVETFSDGEKVAKQLLLNVTGNWEVFLIRIKSVNKSQQLFTISFPQRGIWILGEVKKLRKNYLRDCFLKAGVKFASNISMKIVSDLLFATYAPEIYRCVNYLEIASTPGWHGGVYLHRNNFPCLALREFVELPVMEKKIEGKALTTENISTYFCEMSNIKDSHMRVWCMLFPFAGILGTLLSSSGHPLNFYLNLVDMSAEAGGKIANILQTHNRDRIGFFNPNISQRALEDSLKKLGDEVFLVDCRYTEGESYYKGKRTRDLACFIGEILTRKKSLSGTSDSVTAAFVAVSSEIIFNNNVVNLFITDDLNENFAVWDEDERREVISSVIYEVIRYVEWNYQSVQSIFNKQVGNADNKIIVIKILYEIMVSFWANHGVDFSASANLPLEVIESLFVDDFFDQSGILPLLRTKMRKAAKKQRFIYKIDAEIFDETAIYYDSEILFFPKVKLNEILIECGMSKELPRILLALKEEKQLVVAGDGGFTKKLQIAGVRKNTYQIRRDFFNTEGLIDIVDLGMAVD